MASSALGAHGALELATLQGARFLGAEKDLGSLTVGKLADLQVLEKNPLEDIHNTTSLRWVMKGGALYEADTLDELWPEAKPYGRFSWSSEADRYRPEPPHFLFPLFVLFLALPCVLW